MHPLASVRSCSATGTDKERSDWRRDVNQCGMDERPKTNLTSSGYLLTGLHKALNNIPMFRLRELSIEPESS